MRLVNSTILITSLFWICFSAQARVFVSEEINLQPSPKGFSVCYDHTCKTVQQVSISPQQWSMVTSPFNSTANSAKKERQKIGEAIAKMENLVGKLTNTFHDKAYNLPGLFADGKQMDCIDESTNSTTYLTMFASSKKLKYHTVENPITRGFFIFGWPHTTAVIRDLTSQENWAVDSWFYDNGQKPAIVPMAQWKKGWDLREQ